MATDLTSSVISGSSSQTTSGQIHFAGLGSGTDFDTMITKLAQVESTRMNNLAVWKQSWADKKAAFQGLNTKLLSLQSTLRGMSSLGSFLKKAASSNAAAIAATAGADADNTPHAVSIKQLAQNKILVTSSGYASPSAVVNSSEASQIFAYTYKGVLNSVTIPPRSTLADLRNLINTSQSYSSNSGVKSSVLYDGISYYLQFRAMDTGSSASLTVSASTTLAGFSGGRFQSTQNNQNALLKLDGWPVASNSWLSRQSNSISDLVPGVTLSLKGTGTNILVTATNDEAAIIQNVHTFVDQVNQVLSQIRDLTKVDAKTNTGSLLTGNYGVQIIGSTLMDALTRKAAGFDYNRDKHTSLSQFGIGIDATEGSVTEGRLVVDDTVLAAAVSSNADSLGRVFAASYQGEADGAGFSYQSHIGGITKPGTFPVDYTVSGGAITSATINGHAAIIDKTNNMITGAPGQDESGLSIQINNATDGTYSGNIYLKQGKSGEIADILKAYTDSNTGPLAVLQKNYQTIIDNLDSKIASEQRRVSQYQTDLRTRFAKLDALLGTYHSQLVSQSSQIARMSSGKNS